MDLADSARHGGLSSESEAHLSAMFSQAAVGLAEADAKGRFVRVSDRYCEIVGWPREALLGMRLQDITHPDDLPKNKSLLEAAADSGNPFVMEKRYLRPDGSSVWVNISVTPLFGADGQLKSNIAVAVDIGERRNAEAALAESEERYRLAVAAFHGATYETDWTTGYAYRAPQAHEMLGVPHEEAAPTPGWWFDRIHAEDQPRFRKALDGLLRGDSGVFDIEFRIQHENGGWVWVWQRGLAVRDAAGRVIKTSGALLDITKRKQAEAALRESEARFRHMADSAPALIWMTDAEGKVAFANMHFDHIFGRPAADMLGRGWRQIVHPQDYRGFAEAFLTAFRKRQPFKAEVRVIDGEQQIRWLRCDGVVRLDDAGSFLGYTGCGVDITDSKLAGQRQQLLIHELNHRVKNSLATVQSIATQTLRNASTTEEAREAFESRLLALSRAHDVLTRENWEGARLGEIVAEALDPYRSQGRGALATAGPEVRLSPRTALSLAMALQELATNAAKYGALSCEGGRVRLAWELAADTSGPRLRLRWEESGGPPVAEPARRGFGTRLLERSLAEDLAGEVRIEFAPAGVICTIDAPLGREGS